MNTFFFTFGVIAMLALWTYDLVVTGVSGGTLRLFARMAPGLALIPLLALELYAHKGIPSLSTQISFLFLFDALMVMFPLSFQSLMRYFAFISIVLLMFLVLSVVSMAGRAADIDQDVLRVVVSVLIPPSVSVFDLLRKNSISLMLMKKTGVVYAADFSFRLFRIMVLQSLAVVHLSLHYFVSAGSFLWQTVPVLVLMGLSVQLYLIALGSPSRNSKSAVARQNHAAKTDSRPMNETEVDRDTELFERVERYMKGKEPYLEEDFSLPQLASEMCTNKTNLSHAINAKSGKNFCQYVNSYRIEYAVSLMRRDKDLRMVEVAEMSGFHALASFNMAFRLFMNDTPSEYMRTLHCKLDS